MDKGHIVGRWSLFYIALVLFLLTISFIIPFPDRGGFGAMLLDSNLGTTESVRYIRWISLVLFITGLIFFA